MLPLARGKAPLSATRSLAGSMPRWLCSAMRLWRSKSNCGRPIWTALKPNTSSTALSIWAHSQRSTYSPLGVANQSDRVDFCCASTKTRPMSDNNEFEVIPLRAFKDNYIWTLRNDRYAAVVDPGDAQPVLDYLQSERLQLCAILATHHHPDHVGGVADLLAHRAVPRAR